MDPASMIEFHPEAADRPNIGAGATAHRLTGRMTESHTDIGIVLLGRLLEQQKRLIAVTTAKPCITKRLGVINPGDDQPQILRRIGPEEGEES